MRHYGGEAVQEVFDGLDYLDCGGRLSDEHTHVLSAVAEVSS